MSSPQQIKLTADEDETRNFGTSLALSSDSATALIGGEGSAYVFEQSEGSWSQQTQLATDDISFGRSVAVSNDGTTALIGAPYAETPNFQSPGAAYAFEKSGGSWTQQAKLIANDRDSEDSFGTAVSLSGDGTTALIGAWLDEDPYGENSGSAYVFENSGSSWSQQAKLAVDTGDDESELGTTGDRFGKPVALSNDGTTALIGARFDEDPHGDDSGSAYVYENSGSSWSQQAKLNADDGDEEDLFGWSLSLSNDGSTALIGAKHDEDPNGNDAGSAYLFDSTSGSWRQQTKLVPDDGGSSDSFGESVAVSNDGTTALIGANGDGAGTAYVFDSSDEWSQRAKHTADDGDSEDGFGWSVALSSDGSTALIGAVNEDIPNRREAGAAYVFEL